MVITIDSAADAAAAESRVRGLLYDLSAAEPGPIQVLLPAGATPGLSLRLGDPLAPRQLDLRVQGRGTVLQQGALDLAGRSVSLQDVVLSGSPPGHVALRISATDSMSLSRVGIVDVSKTQATGPGSHSRQRIVELQARGPAVQVTVGPTAWVGNRGQGVPLLDLVGQGEGRFDRVTLVDARFVDNQAAPIIVAAVGRLDLERVTRSSEAGEFLSVSSPATLVMGEAEPGSEDAPALKAALLAGEGFTGAP